RYQEDHLISLELGGDPTDPRNLWPEPYPRAAEVDRIENELNAKVCDGRLTLAEAQRQESALKHAGGWRSWGTDGFLLGNSEDGVVFSARVLRPIPAQRAVAPPGEDDPDDPRARAGRGAGDRDHERLEGARPGAAEDAESARRHRHRPDRHADPAAEP